MPPSVIWGVIYVCSRCYDLLKLGRGSKIHTDSQFICALCRSREKECYRLSSYIVTEQFREGRKSEDQATRS